MNIRKGAGMQWEHIGCQELKTPGRGYVYLAEMWRTPVPGGWLLMSLNSKSNSPDPEISIYKDVTHLLKPNVPPEASYLLRAVDETAIGGSDEVLLLEAGEAREQE